MATRKPKPRPGRVFSARNNLIAAERDVREKPKGYTARQRSRTYSRDWMRVGKKDYQEHEPLFYPSGKSKFSSRQSVHKKKKKS